MTVELTEESLKQCNQKLRNRQIVNMKYKNIIFLDRINNVSGYHSTFHRIFIPITKKYINEYNKSENNSTATNVYHPSTVEVSTFANASGNLNFNI